VAAPLLAGFFTHRPPCLLTSFAQSVFRSKDLLRPLSWREEGFKTSLWGLFSPLPFVLGLGGLASPLHPMVPPDPFPFSLILVFLSRVVVPTVKHPPPPFEVDLS